MSSAYYFWRSRGRALILSLIRFLCFFFLLILISSCVSKKPIFRTPLEVFKGHDGKRINNEQLDKFFEVAQNADRDARSVAFRFLSKNLDRFERVSDFLLSRVVLEEDYNVKSIIVNGLIRWNRSRTFSSTSFNRVTLKPKEQQLLSMIDISRAELKKESRGELQIASVRLMESVFFFAHENKIPALDEITQKVKQGCLDSLNTTSEIVFPYALFCIKSMRDRGVDVAVPSLQDTSKNALVKLYLDTKIFLQ